MGYNTPMKDERRTIKIWANTLPKLRLIYALTGESMVAVIDRLVAQELERIQKERVQHGS